MSYFPTYKPTRWERIWWTVKRWPIIWRVVRLANALRFWLWKTLYRADYEADRAAAAAMIASLKKYPPTAMFSPAANVAEQFRNASLRTDRADFAWYSDVDVTLAENFRHRRTFAERFKTFLRN